MNHLVYINDTYRRIFISWYLDISMYRYTPNESYFYDNHSSSDFSLLYSAKDRALSNTFDEGFINFILSRFVIRLLKMAWSLARQYALMWRVSQWADASSCPSVPYSELQSACVSSSNSIHYLKAKSTHVTLIKWKKLILPVCFKVSLMCI